MIFETNKHLFPEPSIGNIFMENLTPKAKTL